MSVGGSGAVTASQILKLVQQSMQPELERIDEVRDEVTAIEDKKLAYNNIDRAIEQLQSTLKLLQKESTFGGRIASTSNSDLVTAVATSNAARTSFSFSSITQLATAAMITSNTSLELVSGTAPFMVSSADINGGATPDFNPNVSISSDDQGVSPAIVSGTFTINGTSIEVKNGDTLYTILTRINNAGTGVVATFDDTADTVRISGTTIGADETITFDSGETNFFEALNLSSVSSGTDHEKDQTLDSVSTGAFGSIQDGYFNINNHTFYVDVSEDSMQKVINRVNSSNCGAVMFYDSDTNKVTITNEDEGKPLILSNDTSNFLDALEVHDLTGDQDSDADESIYVGQKAQFTLNGQTIEKDSNTFTIEGVTFTLVGTTSAENPSASVSITANTDSTIEQMETFATQYNATLTILNDKIEEEGGPLERDSVLRRLRTKLRTGVLSTISNPGQYTSLQDLGFSFSRGSATIELDTDTLRSKLEEDETSVRQLFAYNDDTDGLLDDGGYAVNTYNDLNAYTRAVSGFFFKRNDQLDEIIERLELKIYDMEEKLIDKEERLFNRTVASIQALQDLQAQGQRVGQVNNIVLSGLASSAAGVF